MTGRALIKLCLAVVGMGLASPALAADYDGQLPSEGFNGMWGCLYARFDGGGSFYADNPTAILGDAEPIPPLGQDSQMWMSGSSQPTLENTGFFEGGIGCQVTDSMRVEVVGGLNLKSSIADESMSTASYLDGDFSARYVFVSGYWDITNYAGFTPYVGGGIGGSYNELSGNHYSDVGAISLAREAGSINGGNYDFAYHLTFGMSYDVTESLKFDLAYRYVNFGSANGSITYPLQDDCGGVSCSPVGSVDIGTVDAHQLKMGLRYHFGQ